jgi:hypothetical protein
MMNKHSMVRLIETTSERNSVLSVGIGDLASFLKESGNQ